MIKKFDTKSGYFVDERGLHFIPNEKDLWELIEYTSKLQRSYELLKRRTGRKKHKK